MTRKLVAAAVSGAVAVTATLLSGCGVVGTDFRPGAAAEVGEETIAVDEVNDLTPALCALLQSNEQLLGEGVSGSSLRTSVLQGLVLRSVADQMAEDYDVPAGGSDYQDAVQQTRLQFAEVDQDVLDDALPVYTATAYFLGVIRAVGEQELVGGGGEPTDDEALLEGIRLAREWQEANGVETSPAFPKISIGEDQVLAEREELSIPVSTFAAEAEAQPQDPAYVDALPESQRCS